jgi:hypothetical protein
LLLTRGDLIAAKLVGASAPESNQPPIREADERGHISISMIK